MLKFSNCETNYHFSIVLNNLNTIISLYKSALLPNQTNNPKLSEIIRLLALRHAEFLEALKLLASNKLEGPIVATARCLLESAITIIILNADETKINRYCDYELVKGYNDIKNLERLANSKTFNQQLIYEAKELISIAKEQYNGILSNGKNFFKDNYGTKQTDSWHAMTCIEAIEYICSKETNFSNLIDVYSLIYNRSCSEIHSDVYCFNKRKVIEENKNYQFEYDKKYIIGILDKMVDTSIELLNYIVEKKHITLALEKEFKAFYSQGLNSQTIIKP